MNTYTETYYLYRHIRLDKNEPFYIGIGKRINEEIIKYTYTRSMQTTRRNRFWKNIVAKTDYEVEILFESETKDEIIKKEIEFITLYGRKDLGTGTLCNLTNGGEFFEGFVQTEELRIKRSKSAKGRKCSKNTTDKRTNTIRKNSEERGYWFSVSTREKMSLARLPKEKRELIKQEILKGTQIGIMMKVLKCDHLTIVKIKKEIEDESKNSRFTSSK